MRALPRTLFRFALVAVLAGCSAGGPSGTADEDAIPDVVPDAAQEATSVDTLETTDEDLEDAGPLVPEDTGPPPPSPAELRGAFFSLEEAHLVEITLSEPAVDSLWDDPYSYVSGDVSINGESLPGSGVRLKGFYGSFRTLDEKAAFLLQFGKFDDDQSFLGMNKLALNNMVQDSSHLHEHLAYQLFRAGNVPGSRVTYAWVRVNEEDFGLYAVVEVVDNDHFLKDWFPDDKGNLYEGEYGVDLFPWGPDEFDQDAGTDDSKQDLVALVGALDAIEEGADEDGIEVLEALNAHVDMDRFLTFAATELYMGHWDGYSWSRNNYFIYRSAVGGRWTWIPWGVDQVFWDHLPPFEGEGRIHQLCMGSLSCRAAFAEQIFAVVERVEILDLVEQTWVIIDHIGGALMGDPRMEGNPEEWAWSVEATRNFLQERAQTLAEQMACLDPDQVDEDGDGFSGCGEDCDDSDPQIHPDAVERCNARDDNCNGELDEGGECPGCLPWEAPDGTSYGLCFLERPWEEAWLDCLEQGGELASVHNEETHEWLVEAASELAWGGMNWWIGLNDRDEEDVWAWTDGTPVDFEAWNDGEPNNAGGEDCVHFAEWSGGQWNDLPCDSSGAYICQFP